MSKAMTIVGMVVAGLVGLLFGADLILGFPFEGYSRMMDIGALLVSGTLGYLSWDALRDVR